MQHMIDLERYPLNQPESARYAALVKQCQADLVADGMFNLEGYLRPQVAQKLADAMKPAMATQSFTHQRRHNIYFKKSVPGLAADHPALTEVDTINHTLCADQIGDNGVIKIYEWPPLIAFLAEVMGKDNLYSMPDPLARVNVMAYHAGEALNWHFDRSEFTTTLLLQAPEAGGDFEYRTDLRTHDDPNYDGVVNLLNGNDPMKQKLRLSAGTLNVFRGITTPHRVTPIEGARDRMIAVFSYYETPDVMFSDEERIGFFGRAS
ncbi:MAG: 2OG-Fe(II) oxygenase [Rhodobacterales bacterium]|nr:2OG-Fe(II) oxygenase [Rhodobacterales bacterium]